MPKEYRYPLTRLCIRTGALTLPARLIDLFPSEGTVLLRDAEHDVEIIAEVPEPRMVTGLAQYFAEFTVEVNDDVYLTPQDDGSFKMRLHKRPRRERVEVEVADEIPEVVVVSNGEPETPSAPEVHAREDHAPLPTWHTPAEESESSTPAWGLFTDIHDDGDLEFDAEEVLSNFPDENPEVAIEDPEFEEEAEQSILGFADDDTQLTTPLIDLQDRLIEHLTPFGFTTEIVAEDLVAAYAQLGSKSYSVLFRLLPTGERLDWGVLLTLRRGGTYDYVSIVGDYHDLIAVSNPAAVAKTTLVTWDALSRAKQLQRGVPISALDFRPYLERIGLFEEGVQKFEGEIAAKLAARGNLSELLTALAHRSAPAVLTLTELDAKLGDLADGEIHQLVRILTGAPFHLFEKLSDREVLLTRTVPDMLSAVSLYSESLREQLGPSDDV